MTDGEQTPIEPSQPTAPARQPLLRRYSVPLIVGGVVVVVVGMAFALFRATGGQVQNAPATASSLQLGAPVDDQGFLTVIKFNAPITVPVSFNTVQEEEKALLAAAVVGGAVKLVPKLDGVPWWTFNVADGGAMLEGGANALIGTRVITSRTDQRTWTTEAVQHYAETINYTIVPPKGFAKAGLTSLGTYSIRAVFQNDPAAGSWQYVADPFKPEFGQEEPAETAGVRNQLLQFGRQHLADLETATSAAIIAAQVQTADNVIHSGQMAADPSVGYVAVSSAHKLAFYTKIQPFQVASLNQMIRYCQSVRTPKYGPWRLATSAELLLLLGSAPAMNQYGFIDQPIGRMLGDLERAPPDERQFVLISGTVRGPDGDHYAPMATPAALAESTTVIGIAADANGAHANETYLAYTPGGDALNQSLDFRKYNSEGRVVCVADLH